MQCACPGSYRCITCAVLAGGHYKSGSHARVAAGRARARADARCRRRRARVRQTKTADACQRGWAASSRESSPGRPREVGLRCKRSASRPRAGLELLENWDREAGARRSARSKRARGGSGGSRSAAAPRAAAASVPPAAAAAAWEARPGEPACALSRGLSECLWIYMPSHQDDVHEQQAASLCHASHPP